MATEVVFTDEFEAWWAGLSEVEQDRVAFTVGLLEVRGVTLPHPYFQRDQGRAVRPSRASDPSGGRSHPNALRLRPVEAGGPAHRGRQDRR